MAIIDPFVFDDSVPSKIKTLRHYRHDVGANWPVVYILNNAKEAYVGETIHASTRAEQHLKNDKKRRLSELRIISADDFNKSVILDLESFLIKHMSADEKFVLLNGNDGLQDHDYYQRENYYKEFEIIWSKLRKEKIVQKPLSVIENLELYKYSPYKSLGEEQRNAKIQIIKTLAENIEKGERSTIIIQGGAGTGKTILAIYLMKFFADLNSKGPSAGDDPDLLEVGEAIEHYASENLQDIKKIGIVFPQSSLQKSVKDVFSNIKGLKQKMVMSPSGAASEFIRSGEQFDLLFVDEAHRLKCRYKGHLAKNMYRIFKRVNNELGLDQQYGTELDWLLKSSKNIVFFRDGLQTIRPCDIDSEDFQRIITEKYQTKVSNLALSTQWRCEGGEEYINYLKRILSCEQSEKVSIKNYDVAIYDKCSDMIAAIKEKNKQMDLCRVVAGYAWPWNKQKEDDKTICIQGEWYLWNRKPRGSANWIYSQTALEEIGCIHTVQGFDLNYAGVIIGKDIRYDPKTNALYPDKANYYDQQGKSGVANNPELLCEYLKNIYLTLLSRGMKGTYIYVCDDDLRTYLKRFFDVR